MGFLKSNSESNTPRGVFNVKLFGLFSGLPAGQWQSGYVSTLEGSLYLSTETFGVLIFLKFKCGSTRGF